MFSTANVSRYTVYKFRSMRGDIPLYGLSRPRIIREGGMQLLFTVVVYYILMNHVRCVPLDEFYPSGIVYNDSLLHRNDDDSSEQITLSSVFPFFDENFEIIYVRVYTIADLIN